MVNIVGNIMVVRFKGAGGGGVVVNIVGNIMVVRFNPFTAPDCKIFGLKDARMHLQTVYSGPITHLPSMLCILMKIRSHASSKKKKKGLRVSNFGL